MTSEPEWTDDDEAAAAWPEMIARLVEFGLPRSTAARLVGLPHVTRDVVERWLTYCRLRGRDSSHGSNAFLITRLIKGDIPAPSEGALRRLRERIEQKRTGA